MFKHTILTILFILCTTSISNGAWFKSPFTLQHGRGGYTYDNAVTQVHEDTHGVNSKLRQAFGGNCYYLYEYNLFVRFNRTPRNITLAHVAAQCKYKGDIYNLYMVEQQRYWNDTPLYTYGEWVSYTNGSYRQLQGNSGRTSDCSFYYMFEMAYYSYLAWQIMPDTWQDKKDLGEFWLWNAQYGIKLSKQAEARGIFSSKQRNWRYLIEGLVEKHRKKVVYELDNNGLHRYNKVLQYVGARLDARRVMQLLPSATTKGVVRPAAYE